MGPGVCCLVAQKIIIVFEKDDRRAGFFDFTPAWSKYGGTEWEAMLNIDAITYQRDEGYAEVMVSKVSADADFRSPLAFLMLEAREAASVCAPVHPFGCSTAPLCQCHTVDLTIGLAQILKKAGPDPESAPVAAGTRLQPIWPPDVAVTTHTRTKCRVQICQLQCITPFTQNVPIASSSTQYHYTVTSPVRSSSLLFWLLLEAM